MITNLAFEDRFHYFCLIKKSIDKDEIHLTIELAKTHKFFSKPYGARGTVPPGVYNYYDSFYPAPKLTKSTNGKPGLLQQKILQKSDLDQESLVKIDEGDLTQNLLEIIKKTIHDEHIQLIDDICSSDFNEKTGSIDASHIFMHLYVVNEDSYNITIAIDDFHSSQSDSNKKTHFAGIFFVNNGELWGRPSYAVHGNAMYVAKQLAINCKSEEHKLIKNKLNGNLFSISYSFISIYENNPKYREYSELSNRLLDFIRSIFPDQITFKECSEFISNLRLGTSHFTNFIDSFRLWFLDIAREALETLKTCNDISQAVDSVALLSNSDVFFDLNEEYLNHLSALLVKAGSNNQVNYLLQYFLASFAFLPSQLNAVELLVNNNFHALKQLSPSDSTNIALIYFYQITAKHLASTFNSNIFEHDSDYLDISYRLTAGTKNNELAVLEKLKKIFKRGEFNKILFTLKNNHARMQEPGTAGELLRIYIKCHLSVNANLNLDGIWVFGQLLNDVGLLEIFATKLIEKNNIDAAIEAVKLIQDLEPFSQAFSSSKTQVDRAKAIEQLRSQGISVENLSKLSGIEFENLVFSQFEKLHFTALKTPVTGDYGADLVVEDSEGTRYIVQCKRFASRVNLKAVQEVVAAKKHYSGDFAIVITNNEFLNSAIELAKSNQIELWNGDKLLKFLSGDISFSLLADGHRPLPQ